MQAGALLATSKAQHQVKGGFLLDVIIGKCPSVLQLLASEDQALLVRRDAFLVLDLSLHIIDGVAGLNIQRNRLARQGLHEDLHATSQAQHQVKCGFLLDVVVGKRPSVLQLLASEDQALLVRRDAFLVLDLSLDIIDGVAGLNIQSNRLARQGLHEDLHATSQAQHQVKCGFLLDVVVGKRPSVLQLLASEDQALLVRRDAFLVLDLSLDIIDGVAGLNIQRNRLARQGLHEDLHATSQAQHQVKCGFLLDVVVGKRPSVLQLLASEDQALLVRRDAFLVLDLSLHIIDGVAGLNIQSNRLARQGLHEDLHATSQAQHQVKCGFLLDVVVGKRPSVLQLLASEDQALLVRRDAFLVLDLSLDIIDGVAGLNIQRNRLARQGLHEDLHATSQAQHQVKCGFLLDVIIGKCPSVLQLLASEDQALLVRRDAFLVLDLSLDIIDGVAGLNIQRNRLARQGLHEDLHATSQAQHQVKCGFLLDVVVGKRPSVLQLLASEDQALLVRRDAFLVLDLSLHIIDGVAGLNIQRNRLARQGLHEDLHATSQAQHQVKCGFLLDVVVGKRPSVLQLLASEDQALLVRRDAFLVLDLSLDIIDGVAGLNIQRNRLARQGLHEDLHATSQAQHQVKCGFLLDVIIGKCPSVLQLLASEDQALLVRRDAFLVLDLSLDIIDGVAGLNIQRNRLARQGLHEDLHATSQAQHQVKCGFLLDVVVGKRPSVLQLLASEDQALLVRRDAFLVLDLCLDLVSHMFANYI